MMQKFLIFVLSIVLLLAACGVPSTSQETINQSQLPEVIVYKSPT
ncbi:MAG: hypothetical protein ACWGOY_10795 [Anaerolineales bacterium]